MLMPTGVARRALVASTPLEAWLESVAVAAARSFDLGPEHVALAWEVAGWEPLGDDDRKALALVVLASLVTQAGGSTRLPLAPAVLGPIVEGLVPAAEAAAHLARIPDVLGRSAVVGKPGERRPLIVEGEFLYHQKLLQSETRFAESIAARLAAPAFDPGRGREGLADVLARPSLVGTKAVELSDEQRAAVLAAIERPLTVVSGGPGTGKTSIVVSLLRVLARLGVVSHEIALAAPTGKAAQRIGESIAKALATIHEPDASDRALLEQRPEPQTIHRLLGTSADGSRVKHHEANRLEPRVVIVDESSMIDMQLMERLVRAVRPDARLVLLGDARQLPSVGAGAVLRDLVPASGPLAASVVKLTKNYRMNPDDPSGLAILELARAISPESGPLPPLEGVLRSRPSVSALVFDRAEAIPGEQLGGFLDRWYERLAGAPGFDELVGRAHVQGASGLEDSAGLDAVFAVHERARVLCVTRVGRRGSDAVNEGLHARHVARRPARGKHELAPGEPVLVTANDYEKALWNGDQGVALWVRAPGERPRLNAVFRRGAGFVAFPLELLRGQVERSFAMTVHKAQGSELDGVALVLPEEDMPLVSREILYTAVTRSRRSVVIVGSRELLEAGRARVVERFSGAGERIGRSVVR